jgi:hypothetical protein
MDCSRTATSQSDKLRQQQVRTSERKVNLLGLETSARKRTSPAAQPSPTHYPGPKEVVDGIQ